MEDEKKIGLKEAFIEMSLIKKLSLIFGSVSVLFSLLTVLKVVVCSFMLLFVEGGLAIAGIVLAIIAVKNDNDKKLKIKKDFMTVALILNIIGLAITAYATSEYFRTLERFASNSINKVLKQNQELINDMRNQAQKQLENMQKEVNEIYKEGSQILDQKDDSKETTADNDAIEKQISEKQAKITTLTNESKDINQKILAGGLSSKEIRTNSARIQEISKELIKLQREIFSLQSQIK